jgi:betaine-aldehyde dehydrogenase
MLVDGQWVAALDGRVLPVQNPATLDIVAEVPRATEADVDRAVSAAAGAYETWRLVPPRERGRLLMRVADALEERAEDIARILATETGNAITPQSRPEMRGAVDVIRYFAGLGGELKGETIPLGEHVLSYTRREPLGVVGAVIPWNGPVLLAAVKIAPALLCGNTVVLKSAEDAPLAVLELARVCAEHLPPGVINVITGYGEEAGAALTRHPLVRKLSFTGSTEIGKVIMREAAERIVPVSLELGGKSPVLVFPDVGDDERVVDGIVTGMRFTRQGQSCVAGSRLFLHESIYDSVLERLVAKVRGMRIGDPLDDATDIGALNNRAQFERVCGYIDEGVRQEGVRVLTGGLPPAEGPLSQGYFVEPTVFADVRADSPLIREEIFGPVLVAIPWSDEAGAVRMANDTDYGLAAYIWTNQGPTALRVAHQLHAGFVQVNQALGQFPGQSYGGYKQSGLGREYSLEGMLHSFTQQKNVTVNLAF